MQGCGTVGAAAHPPGFLQQAEPTDLLAEVPLVQRHPEHGLVDLLELRHGELLRQQAVGDVGVRQLAADPVQRRVEDPVVIPRQGLRTVRRRPPAPSLAGGERAVDQREVGDADRALVGHPVGGTEGRDLLDVAGVVQPHLAHHPSGGVVEVLGLTEHVARKPRGPRVVEERLHRQGAGLVAAGGGEAQHHHVDVDPDRHRRRTVTSAVPRSWPARRCRSGRPSRGRTP